MPRFELDLNPVNRITTDAIGKPGQRVFYLQAAQNEQVITLLIEKVQIQSLAVGVEQFLAELSEKFPDLSEATVDVIEETMHIVEPVEPLFRVGELGLGYDSEQDLMILVARELNPAAGQLDDPDDPENPEDDQTGVVRFWCTRSQMRTLVHWGIEIANRGRPMCPQCGEPMEPEGHFCPKKNGHKH